MSTRVRGCHGHASGRIRAAPAGPVGFACHTSGEVAESRVVGWRETREQRGHGPRANRSIRDQGRSCRNASTGRYRVRTLSQAAEHFESRRVPLAKHHDTEKETHLRIHRAKAQSALRPIPAGGEVAGGKRILPPSPCVEREFDGLGSFALALAREQPVDAEGRARPIATGHRSMAEPQRPLTSTED